MQSRFDSLWSDGDSNSRTRIHATMLYEHFVNGQRAVELYHSLVGELDDCDFTGSLWKFDVLSIPDLREAALQDAGRAELIIFSFDGSDPVPSAVLSWMARVLPLKMNTPTAIVVLCESPECHAQVKPLQAAAEQARIDFFWSSTTPGVTPPWRAVLSGVHSEPISRSRL